MSSNDHLLVCNSICISHEGLHNVQGQETLPKMWEALPDKDVKNTFADSASSLFRELLECTMDVEAGA